MVMGQLECYNCNVGYQCHLPHGPPTFPIPYTLLLDNLICPRLRQNVMMKYRGSGAELNYERLIFVLDKKVLYKD